MMDFITILRQETPKTNWENRTPIYQDNTSENSNIFLIESSAVFYLELSCM